MLFHSLISNGSKREIKKVIKRVTYVFLRVWLVKLVKGNLKGYLCYLKVWLVKVVKCSAYGQRVQRKS